MQLFNLDDEISSMKAFRKLEKLKITGAPKDATIGRTR